MSRHFTYDTSLGALQSITDVTSNSTVLQYVLDANGQVTSRTHNGSTLNFTWDVDGRLVSPPTPGPTSQLTASFVYDGLGMRRRAEVKLTPPTGPPSTTTRSWNWAGANGEEEVDEDGRTTSSVGPFRLGEGTSRFGHDALGSVTSQNDGFGAQFAEFSSWGQLNAIGTLQSSAGFAGGRVEAALGLNYNRRRWEDPVSGVFLSRDEVGASNYLAAPNGLGPWSYAALSPGRFTDPDGRRAPFDEEALEISKLNDLATWKEKQAESEGLFSSSAREARIIRRYVAKWTKAIDDAPEDTPVVIRESRHPDFAEQINSLISVDFHVSITDSAGDTHDIDADASFENIYEYEAKNRDLALFEALENGPNNSAFNRLINSLPGGELPGMTGGPPRTNARSPGYSQRKFSYRGKYSSRARELFIEKLGLKGSTEETLTTPPSPAPPQTRSPAAEQPRIFGRTVDFTPSTGRTYKIFQRTDINWQQARTGGDKRYVGKTNYEAAQAGLPPQLQDGSFATLHHSQQNALGPWFEASTRYHNIANAKKPPLHPYRGEPHPYFPLGKGPGSMRESFQDYESPEYWKWRSKPENQ